MPKTKKQMNQEEIWSEILNLTLGEKKWLFDELKANIQEEASVLKKKGEEAAQLLQSVNGSGVHTR